MISGPYFPTFGLNTEIYIYISPNAGKYGSEKLRIRTFFTPLSYFSMIKVYHAW